jgi:hypothetical protein
VTLKNRVKSGMKKGLFSAINLSLRSLRVGEDDRFSSTPNPVPQKESVGSYQ